MDKITKNIFSVPVETNALKDVGDGVVEFSKSQVITDDSTQYNGTKYDIKSMDISEYKNTITADHESSIEKIIGETIGVKKGRNRITIDGIRFAIKESALGKFAYDMMKGGFIKDLSIESIGPWPDDEGVYHDAKLIGLSLVVLGNNKSATINKLSPEYALAMNSIQESKSIGLDTKDVENLLLEPDKKEKFNLILLDSFYNL